MNETLHRSETGAGSPTAQESEIDSGIQTIPGANSGVSFEAFEETIICPGCKRPLQMMLQPVHASIQIRCPRCVRQLTPLIRRAIRERTGA